jgi:hypothetical protein
MVRLILKKLNEISENIGVDINTIKALYIQEICTTMNKEEERGK